MSTAHADQLGQHMLVDKHSIQSLISTAKITREDTVIEIGPGTGNITRELAKKAAKVIAIEKDPKFKDPLSSLPSNVKVFYGDALRVLPSCAKDARCIIANMPFHICEAALWKCVSLPNISRLCWIAPESLFSCVKRHAALSAWYEITRISDVPPTCFSPIPATRCAIMLITKRTPPSLGDALLQNVSLKRTKTVNNALRESIIELYLQKGKALTKKMSQTIIDALPVQHLAQRRVYTLSVNQWEQLRLILKEGFQRYADFHIP